MIQLNGQRYICPLAYNHTGKSFKLVDNYINRNIKKSIVAYEKSDSATINILTKYAWEAFYKLSTALDTALVNKLSFDSSNILKYQSVWSQYFHIKENATYVYSDKKSTSYKFLVELHVETKE